MRDFGLSLLAVAMTYVENWPRRWVAQFAAGYEEAGRVLPPEAAGLREAWGRISPPKPAEIKEWRAFSRKFRRMLQEEADLAHDFKFSDKDWRSLEHYLASTERMVQCLEVASVTDREGILDSVFSLRKAE